MTAFARIRPSFLIIGAQRSGTTSLYQYLTIHPGILPALRKEVHFFDFQYEKGLRWYLAHFPGIHRRSRNQPKITGEASPYYMVHPLAPERVKAFNPDIKLIALLRDPVDRALSHYRHEVRNGVERLSFEEAIATERKRLSSTEGLLKQAPYHYSFCHHHYSYLERGRYAHYLEMWLNHFPRESLLVLKSEDMFRDVNSVANRVFGFLGLPTYRIPRDAGSRTAYQSMHPEIRGRLHRYFASDQKKLAKFFGNQDA